MGWLLAEMMPLAVRAVLDALSIARKARLEAERARLVEFWGLDGKPRRASGKAGGGGLTSPRCVPRDS